MAPLQPERHIIIIGGGIIGVSTAYYLSRHPTFAQGNIRITIVEGSDIAAGASGKAGGLLAIDWHGPSTTSLAKLSYTLHSSLSQEYSGDMNWGYRQLDTLSISADFRKTTNRKAARKDTFLPTGGFDWLDQEVVKETSSIGSRETTSQVHPYLFTTKLASLAVEKGVEIKFATVETISRNTTASGFTLGMKDRDTSPSNISRNTTASGFTLGIKDRDTSLLSNISGTEIVIATGPWTGDLLKKLEGKKLGGRAREIIGSRAHSIVVRSAEDRPLPAQALFTSIKTDEKAVEPEIYNRPDGTAYVCGPVDSSSLPRLASEVTIDPAAISLLKSQAAQLSPDFLTENSGAKVEKEQACYLPMGSGDPVIAKLDEGIYVASGHSCWGICNGPGTGLCMAELILDGRVTSADIGELGP